MLELLYILLFFGAAILIAIPIQKGLDRVRRHNSDDRSIRDWQAFSNSKDGK